MRLEWCNDFEHGLQLVNRLLKKYSHQHSYYLSGPFQFLIFMLVIFASISGGK